MNWMETLAGDSSVATIQAFLAEHDDPRLAEELDLLQRAAIDSGRSWSGHQLRIELAKAFKGKNRRKLNWLEFQLPPLNPSSTKS